MLGGDSGGGASMNDRLLPCDVGIDSRVTEILWLGRVPAPCLSIYNRNLTLRAVAIYRNNPSLFAFSSEARGNTLFEIEYGYYVKLRQLYLTS